MTDAIITATDAATDAVQTTDTTADAVTATTDTTTTTDANPWADPVAAKAEIERLRRENGADRTNAKAQAAEAARNDLAQQIGKALGLVQDEQAVDPAALTQQLTTTQQEAQSARLELAVYKAANAAKADAAALLDSRSFLEQVAQIDPTDSDALAAAIATATQNNPRLKASQAAAVGGADLTGGAGTVRTYTRAQIADTAFYEANKTDIDAAYSEGRITA